MILHILKGKDNDRMVHEVFGNHDVIELDMMQKPVELLPGLWFVSQSGASSTLLSPTHPLMHRKTLWQGDPYGPYLGSDEFFEFIDWQKANLIEYIPQIKRAVRH